jgi:hypothetical protein
MKRKFNKYIVIIILISIVTVVTVGWMQFKSSAVGIPTLPLLKDKWGVIQNTANNWHNNPQLVRVTFEITKKDFSNPSALKVYAEYRSAKLPDNVSLYVFIDNSERVYTKIGQSTGLKETLYKQDWKIESQDALYIFSKNEIVKSCLNSPSAVIRLNLSKDFITHIPTWDLVIFNCPDNESLFVYYLNAQTGEIITDPFTP